MRLHEVIQLMVYRSAIFAHLVLMDHIFEHAESCAVGTYWPAPRVRAQSIKWKYSRERAIII